MNITNKKIINTSNDNKESRKYLNSLPSLTDSLNIKGRFVDTFKPSPRLTSKFNNDSPLKVLLSLRLGLVCVRETGPKCWYLRWLSLHVQFGGTKSLLHNQGSYFVRLVLLYSLQQSLIALTPVLTLRRQGQMGHDSVATWGSWSELTKLQYIQYRIDTDPYLITYYTKIWVMTNHRSRWDCQI